jgi:hypothetical protein
MKSVPRLRVKLALLGLSLLVAAGLLEVGIVLVRGEQAKFPRHVVGASFGLRVNEPNATYRHKSADVTVSFRINGQGMRADRDYPREKPPGVKRIVSLGDSFTVGYEVDVQDSFSSILERDLRARGIMVEVLNAGVSGYGTAEECLYLERDLLQYDPDLVLVSYFANDLVDNVRSGLFRLQGEQLVESASSYVPAGRLGNSLNTNAALNSLSERSNAFVLLKEELTHLVKRRVVESNVRNLDRAANNASPVHGGGSDLEGEGTYQRKLVSAIFERMYRVTSQRGIPFVIQSIPSEREPPYRLFEMFPLQEFDVYRKGISFFPAKRVLEPEVGKQLLYWKRSHGHWTPYSHALAGRALAELVFDERLLETKR